MTPVQVRRFIANLAAGVALVLGALFLVVTQAPDGSPRLSQMSEIADMQAMARWNATYAAAGSIRVGGTAFAVPPTLDATWAEQISTYVVIGATDTTVAGFGLRMPDPAGEVVTAMDVTLPFMNAGSVASGTAGVVLERAVRLLGLPIGATDESPTTDHRYSVAISRPETSRWKITIEPDPNGGSPQVWLTSAAFDLSLGASEPPFPEIRLSYTVHQALTTAAGSIVATRVTQ